MRKEAILPMPSLGYSCIREEYEYVLLTRDALGNEKKDSMFSDVFILAYTQTLMNNDEIRDLLLNRLCDTELKGVPVSKVYLVLMFKDSLKESGFTSFLFEPDFSPEEAKQKLPDLVTKRRRWRSVEYQWHSSDIQCGDITLFTDPEKCVELSQSAIQALLVARTS